MSDTSPTHVHDVTSGAVATSSNFVHVITTAEFTTSASINEVNLNHPISDELQGRQPIGHALQDLSIRSFTQHLSIEQDQMADSDDNEEIIVN